MWEKILAIIVAIGFLALGILGIKDVITKFQRAGIEFKVFTVMLGTVIFLSLAVTHNISTGSIVLAIVGLFFIVGALLHIIESIYEARDLEQRRGLYLLVSNVFTVPGLLVGLVIWILIVFGEQY